MPIDYSNPDWMMGVPSSDIPNAPGNDSGGKLVANSASALGSYLSKKAQRAYSRMLAASKLVLPPTPSWQQPAAAVAPTGSYGGGYTPPPPIPAPSFPAGSYGGGYVPPTPRAPAPQPLPTGSLAPAQPLNLLPTNAQTPANLQQPSQVAQDAQVAKQYGAPVTGPSLIQSFMNGLSNSPTAQPATSAQLSGTPYGVTGSLI